MSPARALIGAIAGLLVATPGARADDWWARDKALHFGASATLALGGYGAAALFSCSETTRLLTGAGLALGLGVGKEVVDRYTGGDPSWKDLGWDVIGTATGLVVAWSVDRLLESPAEVTRAAHLDCGPRWSEAAPAFRLDLVSDETNRADASAAAAESVDPTLVSATLQMTPDERLRQNDRMVRTILQLRRGFGAFGGEPDGQRR